MKEFITNNGGIIAFVILCMTMTNFVLMGVQKALEYIKDKTASNFDNKLYEYVHIGTVVLTKIIDWFAGNREHK